jgi:hypothetical protein
LLEIVRADLRLGVCRWLVGGLTYLEWLNVR